MGSRARKSSVRVTVILLQGDRFNVTQEALEALYANTPQPFHLRFVDAGSPAKVRDYLRAQSRRRGFELIRSERYLTPNQSRNLGLKNCTSDYVVFLESDVIVAPGWLEALLDCAETTGAAVVTPLTCENLPLHTIVHQAGGEFTPLDRIESFLAPRPPGAPPRVLDAKVYHHRRLVAEVAPELKRERIGAFERHCVLMRRATLERIGGFDEKMLATREHFDSSMLVYQAGGEVWFEPRSVVTFLTPDARPLSLSDVEFFSLRWSDAWQSRTLEYFRRKWELAPSSDVKYGRRRLNWRRRHAILRPVIEAVPLLRRTRLLARGVEWAAQPFERLLNRWIVARYERDQAREGLRPPYDASGGAGEESAAIKASNSSTA